MQQFNDLHDYGPTDPPRESNIQPTAAHFKPRTYPPQDSPVFLNIMGRLNNHLIDNGDVEVHPSDYTFESNSESFPYQETTPIK